jgi:hypothetical protein
MVLLETETIKQFGVLNGAVQNKAYVVARNYVVTTQYKFKRL